MLHKLANVYRSYSGKKTIVNNIKFTRNESICTLITHFSSVKLGHGDPNIDVLYNINTWILKNTNEKIQVFWKLDLLNAKPVARAKKKQVKDEPNTVEM